MNAYSDSEACVLQNINKPCCCRTLDKGHVSAASRPAVNYWGLVIIAADQLY